MITPDEALAALGSAQEHAATTHQLVSELREELRAERTPPRVLPFVLSADVAGQNIQTFETRYAFASFTLVNPTDTVVYFDTDGQPSYRTNSRAKSVPGRSLITLPLTFEAIELGADPADLAAGDATGWLFFHNTILPPFLGGAGVTA